MAIVKTTNRIAWEGFVGLARTGEVELSGRVGTRLAQVRLVLAPIYEALNKQREKLIAFHEVFPDQLEDLKPAERRERMVEFGDAWDDILDDEVEWNIPATIEAKKLLSVVGLRGNDIASLAAAGIVVGLDNVEEEGGK